jgi:hypothetical protein
MDVAGIAVELYRLAPADFTAARNARAKETNDSALAAKVRALPKASASAWAVNQVAAQGEDVRKRFADLGAALRTAQEHADRAELTKLIAQRRALLAETSKAAAVAARQHGVSLSASASEEVAQSMQAALADEAGFAAVFSGRLVRPIRSDGLEPTDLSGAVGGPELSVPAPRRRQSAPQRAPSAAATKKRDAAIRKAAAAAERADAAAEAVDQSIDDLEAERGDIERETDEIRARLEALVARQKELDGRSRQLSRDRTRAREDARRARREVEQAEG